MGIDNGALVGDAQHNGIANALKVWRDSLVNLTGVNRLINFKHTKSGTIQITNPPGQEILDGLRGRRPWSFRGAHDDDQPFHAGEDTPVALPSGSVLHSPKADKDLGPVLRSLMRKARQEYLDRGLSVLYLALGMLDWRETDGISLASPLLLIPVELTTTGPRDRPRLRIGDGDPVFNPALALRMQDFGITLPTIDDLADLSIDALFSQVRQVVRGRDGWKVTEASVLSCFSFHKEAMYRDLLDNEEQVIGHPVVRALASQSVADQTKNFLFDEIKPQDIDRHAPPEDTPLVLDADSSQRACVAAAVAGRSFVMDGPPGTGKSQTIANIIGALLHAGKTVLFVSEKAAALEVVRNRLAEAGLDNYLLELHSHKASRKEVATALAQALDNVPVPPPGMGTISRKVLIERREQLNAYAEAMNKIREPLGYSLHDVLGLIANLDHIPAAPTPDLPPVGLTPEGLNAIRDASQRAARAWRPASQGHSYLWRDVTDKASLDTRLYQAKMALEELAGITGFNQVFADAFAITRPSDTPALLTLLAQSANRPGEARDAWLTVPDFAALTEVADYLALDLAAIRDTAQAARAHCSVEWTSLPDPATLPPSPTVTDLAPATLVLAGLDGETARNLAGQFTADAERLEARLRSLAGLTDLMHLPPVRTIQDATNVLTLAGLAYARYRPERSWLAATVPQTVTLATSCLRQCIAALDAAESAARAYFTDAALDAPLPELHDRFTNVHRGLRKLRGQYRRDKKTLATVTATGVTADAAIRHLSLAVTWQQARAGFNAAATENGKILGSYWKQRTTDFAAIEEAIGCADQILRLTPPGALGGVAGHVCAPDPSAGLRDLIVDIRADLDRWRTTLAPAPAPAARPELLLEPLTAVIAWLRGHVPPLRSAATRAGAVSLATGRTLSLAEADEMLGYRRSAADAESALHDRADTYRAALGDAAYRGTDTDEATLAGALAWAQATRRARTGSNQALTEEQVKAVADAQPTGNLSDAYARWEGALDSIAAAFAETRHSELATELDDYIAGAEFLDELRHDSSGQDEWFSYQQAREDLAVHDLDAAVDFCINQAVPATQVPQVVDRALLRAWADHIIRDDSALRPLRAQDRGALIEEYRRLDRQLIPAATSDIIRAVNTRRPSSVDVGEPAMIRREGMKKTRHRPVRELIGSTRNATLAIKPCFMMSPLAVSQYLPSDMPFDAVIFDEASQVTPGDAVNCIYRGRALITAGDDRQLPPTSFFDRMADDSGDDAATDVNDFQSILELSKACGAFRNLALQWHYRSRHEALIAFSNYAFYEGKLVTYPGARSGGPDVGVEMLHVPGVYRRGTSRDNLVEAAKVVERVVHHYSTRPDLTLGVVTFSVAQADAIQAALDRALIERPDLERHFDGDRLHGFFIKSLESVQGDERDVIIFSIGYGPDENGKITSNFGALNKPKGWRRLNVAITRARQRIEIITSIRAGNVPHTANESVRHLAAYLDFAERGMEALALDIGPSGRGTDSPFEDSVIGAIRSWGYLVEPQVGAAGYRIDMGVRHPAQPGVFVLGVECDGVMYHSSPAARDRDRLREQVLRGLGWNLHRIWGTAWYRNRRQEEERLLAAITAAIAAPIRGRLSTLLDVIERPVIETAEVDRDAIPEWTSPYRKASVTPLRRWVDPSDPASRFDMASGIEEIATAEGPVHIDVILQRLRDAWDIGRVGSKIRANIDAAIRAAHVVRDGDFIDVGGRPVASVRVPADGVQRQVEHVADRELDLAITNFVRSGGTVNHDDLMTAAARLYGWNRLGSGITARLTMIINRLLANGTLTGDATALSLNG
ncbi:DUF3320 domain-containing protein [Micromonospora sp. RTP1Z1]|uniref:DUF3320 domain-containing protein n=1 Tax=Micromonospora sp. RTP1Z1 TaxID=2994043 RepID=UPI0029C956F3|nr:DUF3320 domain-containing protein [Micromonospora sp. RTP1Z1]